MSQAVPNILKALSDGGFRLTKLRKSVVEIFGRAEAPVSVPELMNLLDASGVKVNKTSIYREIEFLVGQNHVRLVTAIAGKALYELVSDRNDHQHLVCTSCHRVECVEVRLDFEKLEQQLVKKNFIMQSRSLEFLGICSRCTEAL